MSCRPFSSRSKKKANLGFRNFEWRSGMSIGLRVLREQFSELALQGSFSRISVKVSEPCLSTYRVTMMSVKPSELKSPILILGGVSA